MLTRAWKEDLTDAKERLKAWWDHEIRDRPCVQYYCPRPDVPVRMWNHWFLAQKPDAFEGAIDDFEKAGSTIFWGAECIPHFFVNYGPGILAAVFGCEPRWGGKAQTVWFDRPTSVKDIVPLLENAQLNDNNPWYVRLKRVTEYAAKRSAGSENPYNVTITDLGGILDVLQSFIGPKELILTLKRQPELVDTCRAIILEKWHKIFDDLQQIVFQSLDGCDSWMRIWCPKTWYPIQSDFSAMLSPKWFKRFVLPDIIAQVEHFDYSIYHLDGPNQIPYLDDLLKIDKLTGIQCVPGIQGKHTDPQWMAVYRKIQAAGKNVVMDVAPEVLPVLYNELDPKGLLVSSIFISKILADFFLPKFLGGMAGIDEDEG